MYGQIFDLIVGGLLLLGAWKGYQKGIVKQAWRAIGVIVFWAIGLKISTHIGVFLQDKIQPHWIPITSILLTVACIAIGIALADKISVRILKTLWLNRINRVIGASFTLLIYLLFISGLCYVLNHGAVLPASFKKESNLYLPLVKTAQVAYQYGLQFIPILKDVCASFAELLQSLAQKK